MFNVLVVDDEHVQREGIKDLISEYRFPFHVLEADNGRAAETILNRHPIDILITDVKMPLMSGLELGRLAKKRRTTSKSSSAADTTNSNTRKLPLSWASSTICSSRL